MSKLEFKEEIVNKVIDSTNSSLRNLMTATTIGNNMSIPSVIQNKEAIKTTISDINDVYNDLTEIDEWLVESKDKLKYLNKDLTQLSKILPVDKIDLRESCIVTVNKEG